MPKFGIWARSYWPVLATLVLGLVSGFRGIDNQDLWYDELETAFAVSTHLEGALDPYTLPYYAILHAFTFNGSVVSDFTLRSLSVIAMAFSAAFVARAAWESTESNISSLAAGVILILAPGALRLSHEARPYALAALGSSIAFYLLTKALK